MSVVFHTIGIMKQFSYGTEHRQGAILAKVDIFSGFLGAGKTTLIKKLIAEAYQGEQVVLIENEFGEIGIDGTFLQDAGVKINEMNSGCICCSLAGDFKQALGQVLEQFHPDRILIEPSGVGKLSDVIRAVENVGNEDIKLNGFTTVVDAKKAKMYMKNFGEFFNDQIENAGSIILSHVAGVSEERLDACVALLREHNKDAEIITTDWNALDGKDILAVMEKKKGILAELERLESELEENAEEEQGHHHHHHHHQEDGTEAHHHHHHEDGEGDEEHAHHHHHEHEDGHGSCGCGHHHHHHGGHDADEVFQSVGWQTGHRFERETLHRILSGFGDFARFGQILRAKGIVPGTGDVWLHFDYVPGEIDIREGSAATSGMICVIGADLDEDLLKETFGL